MKKIKIGRWIVFVLLLLICYKLLFSSFVVPETIVLREGDTFQRFLQPLSSWDRLRTKLAYTYHNIDVSHIAVGTYNFTGSYTATRYIDTIIAGPTQKFVRYTVLEGWSIYDIDAGLTAQGLIKHGEYIAYAQDYAHITTLQQLYPFLTKAGSLHTLEGFLYPDTYFLDHNSPIVSQLVKAQLDTFAKKIWSIYSGSIDTFTQSQGLDWYDIITLASVVQKEERNTTNQATIAGIFLYRMSIGMRLDADITLCYYYKKPYTSCDPSFIGAHINQTQPYNTRTAKGLPPTPIANIPSSTIGSVLMFTPSSYLYYLHDNKGTVWRATTLDEHNNNKMRYLR